MKFWCSATNAPWTWTWQAYPGVWAFLVLLALAVHLWGRKAAKQAAEPAEPMHPLFLVGLIVLWLALDWPLGPLGASYLASAHMMQFILISLAAPPALLAGLPSSVVRSLEQPTMVSRLLERLTRPVFALVVFNLVALFTHLPTVVDTLMVTQLGSMGIDLLWFVGGILFWWPILVRAPLRPRFGPPLRMLYLVVGLMFSPVMFGLVGFMVYAEHPLYGIYELAPPMTSMSAQEDLQVAGTIMSILAALVAFIGLSVIFFRWSKEER